MNKLLILSAGHGSGDPGACANGQQEHYWTVQICNRVKQYCDGWGMPCDYMPTESGDLSSQIQWVNKRYSNFGDGFALQVHLNAGGGTGCEFWKPSRTQASENIDMANSILNNVIGQTGLVNRGVKDAANNQWGKLGWTDDTNTAAGLIESWFIDVDASSEERANNVAYGIALGVCKYFGHPTGGKLLTSAEQTAKNKAEAERLAAQKAAEAAAKLKAEQDAAKAEKARLEALAKAEAEKAEAEKTIQLEKELEAMRAEQAVLDAKVEADKNANKDRNKFVDWLIKLFEIIAKFFTIWKK